MFEKKNNEQKEKSTTITVIMIVITFLLVGGAIAFFVLSSNVSSNMKNYIEIKAEVIDYKEYEHDNSINTPWSPPTFAPIFQYEINGNKFTYTDKVSSSSPTYEIGDKVSIFVNPKDPYDVITDSATNFFFAVAIAFILFAIFTLCIGLFPRVSEKGINLIISLLFSAFGLAFAFVPGIASGYKSVGKILTAHLPFTIFGAGCVAVGIAIIIFMIFPSRKKRNSF